VSGPLPDPPPMRRLATFRKLTRAGGEPYWVARIPGAKLVFVKNERGAEDEYILLQAQDLERDRKR
jgi:hypothetical protein